MGIKYMLLLRICIPNIIFIELILHSLTTQCIVNIYIGFLVNF